MENATKLTDLLKKYNDAYRNGNPLISDHQYDWLVEELRGLDPNHPFLHVIEPEKFDEKIEIRHPVPMLSTDKAYTKKALERFISRVKKAADQIGVSTISFTVTPKLDGLAGRDDGLNFATRGNGEVGYEISSAFKKGVIPIGGRGLGLGEIVIVQSYFESHLLDEFEHPRNMVVGIISSDTLNDYAKKALQDKMVHFVPYTMLPSWEGKAEGLLRSIEDITSDLILKTDYPTDGAVASVSNDELKAHMGATAHHYRWQIAIKTKGETALTTVEGIKWQVGRTGNVTPVLEIQPVSLSGATIRRVTGHNAGLIQKKHIGVGARIEVIRSGEVIPKIENVVGTSDSVYLPKECPECGTSLEWSNDFLKCANRFCKAQITQSISHWFKTLGNADWFGVKTIQKLVNQGFDSLEKIYAMDERDFLDLGLGPVQSKNLAEAINISKSKPVEDWRFLAAFGIPDLGTGDSRKLLSHIKLEDLLCEKAENIEKIKGFGTITSKDIANGLKNRIDTITHMLAIGFNLEKTPPISQLGEFDSPIAGKHIVFTGRMINGTREEAQAEARRLSAIVQINVNGKTDYLVCGENVGASKIGKAAASGALIISENEYYDLTKSSPGDNNDVQDG